MSPIKSLVPIAHAASEWLDGVAGGIPDRHIAAVVIALYNLGMLRQPSDPDPIALLRRLVGFGWRPDPDNEAVLVCRYCNETVWIVGRGEHELRHEPDCPWVAAKAFLDGLTPGPAE